MTYYDVYIGRLDDPGFSWGSEGGEGSPPGRLSPFFPYAPGHTSRYPGGAFGVLLDAIERGRFEGRQVDWGACVAVATKEEIAAFLDELYGNKESGASAELRGYVAGLEAGRSYALVASEL
ncbi:MAG: hypothetical protein M3Q60_01290 [Actinomycetota bacterium]|nr:hypothetical protein [Actinomycetota bacterium]